MHRRLRRALDTCIDPRGSLWMTYVLCGLAFTCFFAWDRLGARVSHGGRGSFHFTQFANGEVTWYPPPGSPPGVEWDGPYSYSVIVGAGYRRFEAPMVQFTSLGSQGGPADSKTNSNLLAKLAELRLNRVGEESELFALWMQGRTAAVQRTWWSYLISCFPWVAGAMLACALLIVWLRRVQDEWHRQQIARFNRGLCPMCAYDLSGVTTGQCPECGRSTNQAVRDAKRALLLDGPGTSSGSS